MEKICSTCHEYKKDLSILEFQYVEDGTKKPFQTETIKVCPDCIDVFNKRYDFSINAKAEKTILTIQCEKGVLSAPLFENTLCMSTRGCMSSI